MQYQLAVAEIHAFRVTGGAGGVESGGDAVLVEIGGEVEVVAGPPREQASYSPWVSKEALPGLSLSVT